MNLKKIIYLSVIFALISSIVFSNIVFAGTISEEKLKLMIAAGELPPEAAISESDVKVKKDQAIEIAKTIIENPELYDVGYVYLNPGWGTINAVWSIEFFNKKAQPGNQNVVVDAETGDVLSFNFWEEYDGQDVFIAKFTRGEAKDKAEEYIKDVLKEDIKNFELQDISGNPYLYRGYLTGGVKEKIIYNFYYVRKVNGVLFPNYYINIGVDGTDGKVKNFNINRINVDSIEFPAPENTLSEKEALEEYRKSMDADLQYVVRYEQKPYGPSEQKAILAYRPSAGIYMLDAFTGKALNYDGTVIESKPEGTELPAAEPIPMDNNAKKLEDKAVNEEEARKIADDYKKKVEEILNIEFDESSNYRPYYPGSQDKIWNFSWNKNVDYKNIHLNMSISADTGHILSLNISNYDYIWEIQMKEGKEAEDIVEKVDWEQGREKAIELIKKLLPVQYGFYSDENLKAPELDENAKKYMREYGYNFTRVVNGIRFYDNNIYISIDRTTGDLRNFNFNWSDIEFPETKEVMPKEEAVNKFFGNMTAKLQYQVIVPYDEKGKQKTGNKANLVYTFVNKANMYDVYLIDAVSGKFVDWSGNEVTIQPLPYDNILKPHWSKRSVELLMSQGILIKPDFRYDESVTREEAVKMMSLAKGMNYYYDPILYAADKPSFADVTEDDPYYMFIENAVRQKILTVTGDEFNGSEKITKLEFVELLTNLMGYGDIAKYKDIYKLPEVSNVSEDMAGYVSICYALGVLPVREGDAFDGNDEVSYAEAAVALYKALSFIK